MSTATTLSPARDHAFDAPRLHGLPGIGLATFLGTTFAGGLIIGDNYRRLGNHAAAMSSVAIGALTAGVLLALLWSVADSLPTPLGTLIALGLALGSKKVGQRLFAEEFAAVEADDDATHITPWGGAGVGLACAAALASFVFFVL